MEFPNSHVWRPIVKSQWDVLCYRQNEPGTPAARIPTHDPSAAWAPPGRPASRRWQVGAWEGDPTQADATEAGV